MTDKKEIRKLQKVGGSTFVVSIPKNWIKELDLESGDSLYLHMNPNRSISIFEKNWEKNRTQHALVSISKSDNEDSIKRKIISLYIYGYNIIEIKTKGMTIKGKYVMAIRDLVRSSLVGTEVIASSSDAITLQVLTKIPHLSFNIALKRMYETAREIHLEAMEVLSKFDKEHAIHVVQMDDEVDRFGLYLMRNLNLALQNSEVLLTSGIKEQSHCLGYRTVVRCVERIADHASLIAKKIKYLENPLDNKILKELQSLSNDSLVVFESAMKALDKSDYIQAENVIIIANDIVEREKKLMDSIKKHEDTTIIKLILEDIRRTAEYSSDIAEVVMDENVNSVILEK